MQSTEYGQGLHVCPFARHLLQRIVINDTQCSLVAYGVRSRFPPRPSIRGCVSDEFDCPQYHSAKRHLGSSNRPLRLYKAKRFLIPQKE